MAPASKMYGNTRKSKAIIITDYSVCYNCKSTGLTDSDKYCPNCRFPQRGTSEDMNRFFRNVHRKKELVKKKKSAISTARNILYFLAGMNLVIGVIMGVVTTLDIGIIVFSVIGASIYFGLGLWSRTKPFPAILSGFFVYIMFNVLNAIADPHTIYQGLIIKIIIISGFIYGYKAVKDAEKLEQELNFTSNQLNEKPDEV